MALSSQRKIYLRWHRWRLHQLQSVANGFYYWKSKNENRYKYVIKLIREWAEKYGIEAVIRIADIVLKE